MNTRLFAYGTLMIPDVLSGVVGRSLLGRAAVLSGFVRYRVRGRLFPGIIEDPTHSTEGVLYTGLTSNDWRLLDSFESDFYDRLLVTVGIDDGRELNAYTYVVAERFRGVLTRESWDRQALRNGDFFEYLKRARRP